MAKIVRYNGNLVAFASGAPGTERTIFGEVTQANDLTSQITPDFIRGWGIVGPSDQPALEDFNGAMYTHGQLLAYLHQIGVAEYNAAQEYHLGSFSNVSGVIYVSLINNNTGNAPATSPAQWRSQSQHGISRHITNGSFTVPAGVTTIYVSGCGGGGGGGGSGTTSSSSSGGGGGGGAGESALRSQFAVTPGQVLAISIGAGGSSGAISGSGGSGGTTTLGAILTLGAGLGGSPGSVSASGAIGGAGGLGFPGGATGADATNNGNGGGYGGPGGSSLFGVGGRIIKGNGGSATAGAAAAYFGSGGSGSGGINGNQTGTGAAGGVGTPGILIIEW